MKKTCVGTVRDAHGIRGDIYLSLRNGSDAPWLKKGTSIELVSPNSQASKTFLILQVRAHKHGVVLKLENLTDRNQAEELKGWTYWLADEVLQSQKGEKPYLGEMLGFTVQTEDGRTVGVVTGFNVAPQYDLLIVQSAAGEVEVPFIEAWVCTMDFARKLLIMRLGDEFLDPEFWKN